MNIKQNDFVLAIRNFEEIRLSAPTPNNPLDDNNIPELYKLFLTISLLIKDYDPDLFEFINKKWHEVSYEEKRHLLEMINSDVLHEYEDSDCNACGYDI